MKSPLIFRVFKNDQIYVVKQFVDKDQVIIGHEAEVDIDLDSNEISSIHCLVEKRDQQFFICDLGSTGGTYKNGKSVLDEEIFSGEEFSVGPYRVVFFVGAPKPVHTPKVSSEIVIEPIAQPVQSSRTTPPPVSSSSVASESVIVKVPAAEKPKINSENINSKLNSNTGLNLKKFSSKKGKKTFAPSSEIKDLREFIKPGKGQMLGHLGINPKSLLPF